MRINGERRGRETGGTPPRRATGGSVRDLDQFSEGNPLRSAVSQLGRCRFAHIHQHRAGAAHRLWRPPGRYGHPGGLTNIATTGVDDNGYCKRNSPPQDRETTH